MESKIIKRIKPQRDNTELKEKCAEILANSDWIESSNLSGITREKWSAYRQVVRELMNNPPEGEVVFPTKPE